MSLVVTRTFNATLTGRLQQYPSPILVLTPPSLYISMFFISVFLLFLMLRFVNKFCLNFKLLHCVTPFSLFTCNVFNLVLIYDRNRADWELPLKVFLHTFVSHAYNSNQFAAFLISLLLYAFYFYEHVIVFIAFLLLHRLIINNAWNNLS